MKKIVGIVCLALWLIAVQNLSAQGWFRGGNGVEVQLGDGSVLMADFVRPDIVRVRVSASGQKDVHTGVCVYDTVAARKSKFLKKVLRGKDGILLLSDSLSVCVDTLTGSIAYADNKGRILLREHPRIPHKVQQKVTENIVYDESTRRVEKTADGEKVRMDVMRRDTVGMTWRHELRLSLQKDEALYGLGSHMEDFMNLRGKKQYLTQHNMKAMVPVLNSTAGYGLLIDCGSEMVFDDASYSADGTALIGVEAASVMCYYFMKGHNMDATVSAYRWLSGTVPMMPLWLFGYTQSKERYVSQADLVSTLREFRNRRIPIDCIVQDWNYWNDGSWGTMSMEPSRYPDKRAMADSVHAMNARLMISIWPNMSNSPQHDEFQSRGYLLSGQNVYDAFRPEARKLYWDYAEREFFSNGFDAWWCDSSEPLDADWGNRGPNYGYDSHEERWHLQSKLLGDVLGRERGMLYSLYHSQGIYEHQRIASDKKRVVNLTRSSYAGQQRYGTIVWNGDTHASWEQFRQMIPAGLNFMATGFPYWTVDAGTFFVRKGWAWFWDGDFEQGCNDPAFREFYVRMLQYATFLPMMRSHGTDTPREPWRFGEEGTPFHDAILDCIRMRYSMLPYTYSLASRITRSDYTLTRCLAFDFPDDRKVWDIKDEFMYGPSILVAPVTTPATVPGEPNYRSVYLPKGNAWYDMTTGKRYAGGTTVSSEVPLQTIPLYVREGSILPVCGSVEYASQYTSREWTVKVYPGRDAEFEAYLDDGDGYACEEGRFATMLLKWDDNRRTLTVCKGEGRVADFVSALCLKVEVIGGGCFDVKNKAGRSITVSK